MNYCVIGEQCNDVFIYGNCERFSPEAPVPVFKPIEKVVNKGMAGNVVANLEAIIDKYGEENEDGEKDVVTCILSSTNMTKTRYVDKKSNHIFLRVDENDVVPLLERENMWVCLNADVVLISDYNKGFLNDARITLINNHLLDKPIFLDSKRPMNSRILDAVSFVKLNESEYSKVDEILKEKYRKKFIVTLGSKGAMYCGQIYESNNPLQTIDVSGAGDTFFSALVFKYMQNNSIAKSIDFANEMANIVVSKRGVSTI